MLFTTSYKLVTLHNADSEVGNRKSLLALLLNARKVPGLRLDPEDGFVMVFLSPTPRASDNIFTYAVTFFAPSPLITVTPSTFDAQ
jgi:hypothetical protein